MKRIRVLAVIAAIMCSLLAGMAQDADRTAFYRGCGGARAQS